MSNLKYLKANNKVIIMYIQFFYHLEGKYFKPNDIFSFYKSKKQIDVKKLLIKPKEKKEKVKTFKKKKSKKRSKKRR